MLSGETPRTEVKIVPNKSTYVSPVVDRKKDDAYGLTSKTGNSEK